MRSSVSLVGDEDSRRQSLTVRVDHARNRLRRSSNDYRREDRVFWGDRPVAHRFDDRVLEQAGGDRGRAERAAVEGGRRGCRRERVDGTA